MKKPLIVLIVALGLMQPAWADFQDGLTAYQKGDYQTALHEFRPLAEQGDSHAQFNYGNNLQVLRDSISTESVDLIYLDQPFNLNPPKPMMSDVGG